MRGERWMPVKFDAGTAKDDLGLAEREIITYCGATQLRWNVAKARAAWETLDTLEEGAAAAALLRRRDRRRLARSSTT